MKKTFEEVVLFARTGLNPRQNFKLGQGNNNYITIKNIKNNSLVIDDNTDVVDDEAIKLIHKRSQIKKGDVLFASIGRMGDMFIIEEEPIGWDINESVFAFTLNTNIVKQKYFYYIFRVKSTLDYLISNSSGSTFKSIKMNQLKKMVFDIPQLEEQDYIISVLDKVCDVIEKRKQELEFLDNLIKARFVEMFGNPVNNEKGFVKAPMGDYMTLLTDFSSNGSYKTLDSGVTMYDEPNYAWMVRTTDLESGDMTSIKYIDENAYELLAKSKIYGGEIIMNKIGSAGKIYLMPQIDMPASLGRNAFMFRYDDRINVKFLYHLLTSEYGQREIQQYVRGAVTKTITKNDVRAVLIMVPPIELQNEFEAFVKQVDKSKVAVQKTLDETKLLFDSLMQKYFG